MDGLFAMAGMNRNIHTLGLGLAKMLQKMYELALDQLVANNFEIQTSMMSGLKIHMILGHY